MKTNNKVAFATIAILITITLGRTDTVSETSLMFRAGDGIALGMTFYTFSTWTGRIEAIGRLKTASYRAMDTEIKLKSYSLGGQGSLLWHIQPLKNATFHLGPAIEISFVHNETKPSNVNDNFTISEGLSLLPWIVAEGGYRILRPLELFVNSQYTPYGFYASDTDFEAGMRFGVSFGVRFFNKS